MGAVVGRGDPASGPLPGACRRADGPALSAGPSAVVRRDRHDPRVGRDLRETLLKSTGRPGRYAQQVPARDVPLATKDRAVDGWVQRSEVRRRNVGAFRGRMAGERVGKLDL